MKPFISIIIPAYNEEAFLASCLNSIKNSTTSYPYEIIVVNNQSSDSTKEIAQQLGVHVIDEDIRGQAAARNAGARIATASILYFIDADCRLPPHVLQDLCVEFDKHPEIAIISGPYVYDQDGWMPKVVTGYLRYFWIYHQVFKLTTGIVQFPGGNMAIRKGVFESLHGFDDTLLNQGLDEHEDLDIAIRIKKAGIMGIQFKNKFAIYSSMRRQKRSPITETVIRFNSMRKQLSKP